MKRTLTRKIVNIDQGKCDGCGLCVPACAEGAIEIADGKARLIDERYCDGLGACLGECPRGAISIEERESEELDEEATELHLKAVQSEPDALPCGCPSSAVARFGAPPGSPPTSQPGHWPIQLSLVPPTAPFLQDADVLLAADCVPFVYAGFHQDFLGGHALLVACPKLDDFQAHLRKLTEVLRRSDVRSITVVRMEVPCCGGLMNMAEQARNATGKDIPLSEVVIGVRGEVEP